LRHNTETKLLSSEDKSKRIMELMILDGNSIVNRAFFGIRMLNALDGTPTNAVYGFLAILKKLLDDYKPDAVCVSFDVHAPTFRHRADENYKANRKGMPDELRIQMPVLKNILNLMSIKCYELEGYEADDILGTAAAVCEKNGWTCKVITGDRDSLQLVSNSTTVCNVKTKNGQTETIEYTPEVFENEYGFQPKGIIDLKALMGDSSDNISGVRGIGEKTAKELIRQFGSIDALYSEEALTSLKETVRKKLIEGKSSAYASKWLATIFTEVPLNFVPEDNIWNYDYKPGLYDEFRRLGFNKLIEKWTVEKTPAQTQSDSNDDTVFMTVDIIDDESLAAFRQALSKCDYCAVVPNFSNDEITVFDGKSLFFASWNASGDYYNKALCAVFKPEIKKVSENIKDIFHSLKAEKLSCEGFAFDTALAGYLLDATAAEYSCDTLCIKYLSTELQKPVGIYKLYGVLNKLLNENGMYELYYNIELPLCKVLSDMEDTGFLVDRKALHDFGLSLDAGIEVLKNSIYSYAGHEFNINSPKQLGTVLFEELMLPSGKKTKSGWSTNADVLEKLKSKHPIVDEVLEYRMLSKLKSTYTDGLSKVICTDGRIHTTFQMTVTATGRLSSTEPNLQNIPIRKNLGAEIRKMFVAPAGKVLVDADYSQIELRLLSCIANDSVMQDAFNSGEDFHRVTASKVFNIPLEEVSSQLRSSAKAVNFGIIYGISAFSLSQDIGVTAAEAKQFMNSYLEKYEGVRNYMTNAVKTASEKGYAVTEFGRRRYLPEISSSNFNLRSFGERVALNMPIQGTAADVIKLAMIKVAKWLEEEKLESRLILQVHDELILECPQNEAEYVCKKLKEIMESVVSMPVTLVADAKCGKTWAEAH